MSVTTDRPWRGAIAERGAYLVRRWSPVWCFLVAFALVVVPSWPGRFNNDTVGMLLQIDRNRITDWHSPLLQYIYKPVREMGGGIAPVLVLTFLVAYCGILLVLENHGLSRLKASLVALFVCVFPVTYSILSTVTRDAWFFALWILALGIARTHRVAGARRFALVFVVVFFAYAARQNAIAIAPFLFAAALWDPTWTAVRRLAVWLRGLLAIAASLVVVVSMSIVLAILPVRPGNIDGAIYLFDLIRLTARSGEMLLPPELNPNDLSVEYIQENTRPWRLDELVYNEDVMPVKLDAERAQIAKDAWMDFVKDDPLEFLRMRWEVMTYQIGLGGNTRNFFIPGIIDNPFGIRPAFPALFDGATNYQLTFAGGTSASQAGVVHRLWPIFLLSCVAAVAAAAKRRGSAYAFDALGSSVAVLGLLYLIAPQVHFRYVSSVYVVLGVACLAMLWPWYPGRFVSTANEVRADTGTAGEDDHAEASDRSAADDSGSEV